MKIKYCYICNTKLSSRQRKYCSHECSWKSSDRMRNHPNKLTSYEKSKIKTTYSDNSRKRGFLTDLSKELGRSKYSISRYASSLGLTNKYLKGLTNLARTNYSNASKLVREKSEFNLDIANKVSEWHAKNDHPRGMLGKSHSSESKKKMSKSRIGLIKSPESIKKMLKTKEKKGNLYSQNKRRSWKSGWEVIGGKTIFLRSSWEKKYAHYLEDCKTKNKISDWEYESQTFWFDGIKRGVRSYLPDFKIINIDGSIEFHEVKGWMDSRSKTKINRMRIYHPGVVLKVFDKSELKKLGII